jgi:transporter family protein
MFQYIYSIISLFSLGTNTAIAKKAIHTASRYQAIVYMYIILSSLLLFVSFVFPILGLSTPVSISLPESILPTLLITILFGALAIIALFKALELGKASIIGPLAKTHVLFVILIGILFFGESLSLIKGFGTLIVLMAVAIISFEGKFSDLRLEQGVPFLLITIGGRSIYSSLLKPVVGALGPLKATLFLEIGITFIVLLYALSAKKNISLPRKHAFGFIFANGFLVFVGSMMYNFSVGAIGIILTAVILSGTPVVNLIVSRVLLGEKLSGIKYAAIMLLVIGLVIIFAF